MPRSGAPWALLTTLWLLALVLATAQRTFTEQGDAMDADDFECSCVFEPSLGLHELQVAGIS